MPLGTAYRDRAAAAGPGTGPYTLGLGLSVSSAGLVGEPSGGGYTRQTATLSTSGNQHTVTNVVTFGPYAGSLGTVRAWGVYNAAGEFLFGGPLDARSVLGTTAVSFTANSFVAILE